MSKKLIVLLAVMAMGLLLAACGGGSDGDSDDMAAPEPVSLTFAGLDEFRYDPDAASVAAGAPVTVTFDNQGALEHDWMLVADGTDLTALTVDNALMPEAHSGVLAAGTSKTFTFTAPTAGTYKIVCTVPGHAAAGMVGTFTVTP